MSGTDGTCKYVLDPDDPATWGGKEGDECYVDEELLNEDGVWACPHDAEEAEDLCIFHLSHENCNKVEAERTLLNKMQNVENNTNSEKKLEFIGAKFDDLALLEGEADFMTDNVSIELSHSEFRGEVYCSEIKINVPHIDFSGSVFDNKIKLSFIDFNTDVYFESVNFKDDCEFLCVNFENTAIFSDSIYRKSVNFGECSFNQSAIFRNVEFSGNSDFFNSKFESITKFRQAHFDSEANFLDSEFQAGGDFSECRFEDYANFSSTQFDGRAFFQSAKFQDKFIINEASFKQEAVFDFVTFDGVVLAKRANFTDKLRCTDGFHDDVSFEGSDFRGLAKFGDFEGVAVFRNCTFNIVVFYGEFQDDADFIQTDFDDEARFRGEFCEGVSFRKANFNTGPDFEDIDISNGIFVDANLQEANISDTSAKYANFRSARLENADMDGTNFSQANFEQAKLSGASLFDANLSGALLYSAHVRDVSVSTNTTFDKNGRYRCIYDPKSKYEYNFDDNQEVYAFATIEKDKNAEEVFDYAEEVLDSLDLDTPSSQDEDSFSTQNDDSISSDTEYENTSSREEGEVSDIRKGINTYYILEQLTRNNALLDEQAKFFVRRQDMRRTQLREDGRQVEYWFAEAQNAVFRHGESFSRVVAWSVGTIIAFAFLYPIGGWLKKESPTGELQQIYTYDAIVDSPILLWESFNHSALLFLTGTGPLKPVGFIGEVLTTSETLIAPILLLLLVFVLGRRAAR